MIFRWAAVVVAIPLLFLAYLRSSQAMGVSADGSSDALQAWDMLQGNVLLRGWTLTDVSFYTNELLHFMAVELVTGLHGEVVNLGVALTFVLLVIVVAAAAGPSWWGRLLAVAVVGVPAMGIGTSVQLTSPDHTGTAIPLLLTWMVLDRFAGRRWVPWAVAGMLAWGQLSDPLVMYIGALPLVVVSAFRMIRDRVWWGLDAQLILAAISSAVLNQAAQLGIRAAGGWAAHPPTVEFASGSRLTHNLSLTVRGIAGNFGAFFPDRENAWRLAMGVVHLGLLALAVVTTIVVLWRLVRRGRGEPGDRLAELAAIGIGVNIGAYLVSTLPLDMGTSRQIIAVVPLAAVLVGRLWGPRLAAAARPRWRLATLGVVGLLALELAVQAIVYPKATNGRDIAAWLDAQGLTHGLGSYWYSNNITVLTEGRVQVFPVVGGERIRAYRSESKLDWYDPAVHDARFIVLDTKLAGYGDEATALRQFGPPVRRHVLPTATILIYDHNLLIGLPAFCVPEEAPSMAQCPPHRIPLFG